MRDIYYQDSFTCTRTILYIEISKCGNVLIDTSTASRN